MGSLPIAIVMTVLFYLSLIHIYYTGRQEDPYRFALTAGVHTITLTVEQGELWLEEAALVQLSLIHIWAKELAQLPRFCVLCGHYEGVDERVLDALVDEQISMGDYVPVSYTHLPARRTVPGAGGGERGPGRLTRVISREPAVNMSNIHQKTGGFLDKYRIDIFLTIW